MDYTKQPWSFKLRKALRYGRLYGPTRTLVKVRGQYHMKPGPSISGQPPPGDIHQSAHVGLIGCGNFAFTTVAYFLRRDFGPVLRGVMDIDLPRAASLCDTYGAAYFTTSGHELITDPQIDLVFIASNHASHAEYAIEALRHGKHVHIEKPHVVSYDQLRRLCYAIDTSAGQVALGFNRPLSPIGQAIARHLAGQPGPGMYSWFVAGHELPTDHWYFQPAEGGRVLGNLCHWTDFVYRLVTPAERYPIRIVPTRAEASDCDIAVSYVFGDGSIAAVTFSAKGHAFEGVKERFAAHRGDVLIAMDDFRTLTVEMREHKRRVRHLFRQHGHRERVRASYMMTRAPVASPETAAAYAWETGDLLLATKAALERQEEVTVVAYDRDRVRTRQTASFESSHGPGEALDA